MTSKSKGRLVYSTDKGRACPECGWPITVCDCAAGLDRPLPEKIIARLRIDRAGRGGKTVTVVAGLPPHREFLKQLGAELRKACGSGGTVTKDSVEIQGDHRDKVRPLLQAKGWIVRG